MASLWRRAKSLVYLTDEEMGKKDDDHTADSSLRPAAPRVPVVRIPPRRSFKRVVVVLLVLGALYIFFNGLPFDSDWSDYASKYKSSELLHGSFPSMPRPPPLARPQFRGPSWTHHGKVPPSQEGPASREAGKEKVDTGAKSTGERKNNGPFKFLELGETLRSIEGTRGMFSDNQNVLFMAMSLKSASALLPLACQMGRQLRNYVHFALMSRDDVPLRDLKKMNGIDESCNIIFHDARPDHAWESTDLRAKLAADRVLFHVQFYMHPQAIIVDGSDAEDAAFLKAMRNPSSDGILNIIELPENGARHLEWITRLDAASLYMWNKVNLEILIHAPPAGSGSLIRLLKSLNTADLWPFGIPRLTIELPKQLERPTKEFLRRFTWPPRGTHNPSRVQMLSLRRRISRDMMDEDQSVIRFLESYWPSNPTNSHVLVLSPQAELTRDFLHYLKYVLLEYRYSSTAIRQQWDTRLVGISLSAPTKYLNASEFTPHTPPQEVASGGTSFLWQAPSSDAILISGQKWAELHSFVSRSLEAGQDLDYIPHILASKVASTKYPAWLEYLVRLCRIRGYFTLYPSRDTASTVATIHDDLALFPEEYREEDPENDEEMSRRTESRSREVTAGASMIGMLDTLPNRGDLPVFKDMPLLNWEGDEVALAKLDSEARVYSLEFRHTVGGCSPEGVQRLEVLGSATDLFCDI